MRTSIKLTARLFSKIFWEIISSQTDDLISKKDNFLYCLKLFERVRLTIIVVAFIIPISIITFANQ
jgi:hypothetical protein